MADVRRLRGHVNERSAREGPSRRRRHGADPGRQPRRPSPTTSALTKPRLNLLVVATSAAGYDLGAPAPRRAWDPDVQAVAGTALVAAGAAVLNQVAERDTDALMRRTRGRALPDGRVPPGDARLFGIVLSAGGLALLARCRIWLRPAWRS